MSYRVRYQLNVDWISPGIGPSGGTGSVSPGLAPSGNAQTLAFFNTQTPQPNSTTFTSGDVTALLAAMSADLSAQMNAQLARVQGFATGGS